MQIAAGGVDDVIQVWDPTSGEEVLTLKVDNMDGINDLVALPGGAFASVAYSSLDKSVSIWDQRTGTVSRRFKGHEDAIPTIAYLDNQVLATGSNDHTIRLWPLGGILNGHTEQVGKILALPGARLVSAGRDHTIRLWDVKAMTMLGSIVHPIEVYALAHLGGDLLAVGGYDTMIRIIDLSALHKRAPASETRGTAITDLGVLSGGLIWLSGGPNDAVDLWDSKSKTFLLSIENKGDSGEALDLKKTSEAAAIEVWLQEVARQATKMSMPKIQLDFNSFTAVRRHLSTRETLSNSRFTCRLENQTIQLCVEENGTPVAQFDLDTAARSYAWADECHLVVGDQYGNLHWMTLIE